jgi:hypothetical protein
MKQRALPRTWPLAVLLLGALLAGCSAQSQDAAEGQQQSTSAADARQKIELIEQDKCFTGDPHQVYRSCGTRYLTEINNVALMARDEAAKIQASGIVGRAVDTIRDKINDFNGRSCATVQADSCAGDLQTINAALAELAEALPQTPGS